MNGTLISCPKRPTGCQARTGKQRGELHPGLMADRQVFARQGLEETVTRLASRLGENEWNEETGIEVEHPDRLPMSQPRAPDLAQQLGSGAPQSRHGGPESGQFSEG